MVNPRRRVNDFRERVQQVRTNARLGHSFFNGLMQVLDRFGLSWAIESGPARPGHRFSSMSADNVLRDRAEELDMSEHRRMILEHFSGTSVWTNCTWAASHCFWLLIR